ncbi:MAG: glycosyltransferase family 2 protein [Desulfobacterales bacterium]|nr:glycosyltransferase family 2 protein [Desulfobacterales bacterium]
MQISAVIIAKNEELNLEKCLKSLSWADEIVVVDSGSQDRTIEIAKAHGARVIETPWLGFGKTKQFAVESASHDWVFSIDADEVVTEALQKDILSCAGSGDVGGYRVQRLSFYLGRAIRFSGWRSDAPLRLFDRRLGRFNDKMVHESVEMGAPVGMIRSQMLHYTYPTIASHLAKIESYSGLGALQQFEKGKKINLFSAAMHGAGKFLKMYVFQLGFLDGKEGFILSVISSFGVALKYFKLWELRQKGSVNE